MPASVIDEVSRNKVWREHCKKERRVQHLSEEFSIPNVSRMQLYAEKPNKVHPNTFRPGTEQLQDAKGYLMVMSRSKGQLEVGLPVTTNKEYGQSPKPLYATNPAFHYPKTICHITAYADAYCAFSGGISPFAKPLGSVQQQSKR
eukprot:jgi/Botrbrau1/22818/Bobra.0132s0141.1